MHSLHLDCQPQLCPPPAQQVNLAFQSLIAQTFQGSKIQSSLQIISNKTHPGGPIHFYYFIYLCAFIFTLETLKVSFSNWYFISYLRRNSNGDFPPYVYGESIKKRKRKKTTIKSVFIYMGLELSQWRETTLLTNRKQVTNKLRSIKERLAGSSICLWCSSDLHGGSMLLTNENDSHSYRMTLR